MSKRLTTEALHIYPQNSYNKKRDTDDLLPVFCDVIDNINKRKGKFFFTEGGNLK